MRIDYAWNTGSFEQIHSFFKMSKCQKKMRYIMPCVQKSDATDVRMVIARHLYMVFRAYCKWPFCPSFVDYSGGCAVIFEEMFVDLVEGGLNCFSCYFWILTGETVLGQHDDWVLACDYFHGCFYDVPAYCELLIYGLFWQFFYFCYQSFLLGRF